MSNRLQVGGLALTIGYTVNPNNVGKVVKLLEHIDNILFADSVVRYDVWRVGSDDLIGLNFEKKEFAYFISKHLMPLGDQKGVEIFELEKEHEFN